MKKLRKLSLLLVLELGCMGAAMPGIVETKEVSIGYIAGLIKSVTGNGATAEDNPIIKRGEIKTNLFNTASWTLPVNEDGDLVAIVNGKKVISNIKEGDTYTFPVTTDYETPSTIIAYYTVPDVCLAIFKDQSDNSIGTVAVNKGDNIKNYFETHAHYSAPTGYTYTWVDEDGVEVDVNADYNLNKNTIFTAKLTKDANAETKRYDVLIQKANGGIDVIKDENDIEGIGFDEQATVTSTAENFSYWMIGEKIVSYEKEYSFSVYSDTVIKEVCGETVEKKPVVTLHRDQANDANLNMTNLYEVKYEVPEGYEFVEAGMIFGGTTIDAAGVEKIVAKNITSNNEFAVKKTGSTEHRAYLIYKNGSAYEVVYDDGYGVEQLVFGNSFTSDQPTALTLNQINEHITSSHSKITASVNSVSVSGSDKLCVYNGKNSTLKIGTTKNNGAVGFKSDSCTFDKAVVNAYSADGSSLSADGDETPFAMTSDAAIHTYNFDTPVSEFKVTTNEKRSNINYIELYYSNRQKEFTLTDLTLGDLSKVISDIELPTEYNGYPVTWSSSNPSVLSNSGVVTCPETGSVEVELTATCNGLNKSFVATVYSTSYLIEEVYKNIDLPAIIESDVDKINMGFGNDIVKIYWTIKEGDTINTSHLNYTGDVSHGTEDVDVKISALIYIGNRNAPIDSKECIDQWTITIKAKEKISNGIQFDLANFASDTVPTNTTNSDKSEFTMEGINFKSPYCYAKSKVFTLWSGSPKGTYPMVSNVTALEKDIASVSVKFVSGQSVDRIVYLATSDTAFDMTDFNISDTYTEFKTTAGGTITITPSEAGHRYFKLMSKKSANVQISNIEVIYK